jgi:TetR/AcrR family transcriptional regulator, biofilm operon repressor
MVNKEVVKSRIGEAAMQCFARFGLEKTTLEDIAGTVGLNKATLYYYYKNKEEIFLQAALAEAEKYLLSLQEKALQKKGVENRVLFYLQERIGYYMHVLNRNKVSTDTLYRLLPRFFELYDSMMKAETKFIASMIREGIRLKEIQSTDPEKLAASLVTISDALKHSIEQQAILRGASKTDYSPALKELRYMVGLIFNGLKK